MMHSRRPKSELISQQDPLTAYLQVALVCVEHGGLVPVICALKLHRRMVDGRLKVAVLGIHHQPHVGLFATIPYEHTNAKTVAALKRSATFRTLAMSMGLLSTGTAAWLIFSENCSAQDSPDSHVNVHRSRGKARVGNAVFFSQ